MCYGALRIVVYIRQPPQSRHRQARCDSDSLARVPPVADAYMNRQAAPQRHADDPDNILGIVLVYRVGRSEVIPV